MCSVDVLQVHTPLLGFTKMFKNYTNLKKNAYI